MDLTKIEKPFGELDRETKLALFAAWMDGEKIECNGTVGHPGWHLDHTYRVAAPPTKPSIDWSHVAPQFKWMATDEDGNTYVYSLHPGYSSSQWIAKFTDCAIATPFASLVPGTCVWKDSLVRRPE